jgi:hypothetical protein
LLGRNNLVPIDKLVQHEMIQVLEHPMFGEYGDNLDWFGPQVWVVMGQQCSQQPAQSCVVPVPVQHV